MSFYFHSHINRWKRSSTTTKKLPSSKRIKDLKKGKNGNHSVDGTRFPTPPLTYQQRWCPKKKKEEDYNEKLTETRVEEKTSNRGGEYPHTSNSTKPTPENRYYQTSATQRNFSGNYQREKSTDLPKQPPNTFHERVDRHGRSFGERVSTKQTRNPPPEKTTVGMETSNQTWKSKPVQERTQSYASPPYSRNRENSSTQGNRGKDLFPQRSLGQWRPRLVSVPDTTTGNVRSSSDDTPKETTLPAHQEAPPNVLINDQALARGAIMEELQEVTRQYLSCPDPVEAAARRQRVLYGDANGMMEETVERLLASGQGIPTEQRRQRAADSNPVTPPPLHENPFQAPLFPDPSTPYTPPTREEEDWGQDPRYSDVLQTTELEGNQQTRIRSIIISPAAGSTEAQTEQTKQKESDGEETLKEFQNKVRRKTTRTAKRKQIRESPNILRGASSKKRKLSQVQNSPKGKRGNLKEAQGQRELQIRQDQLMPLGTHQSN
ncbi:hypothetical protein YC2023_076337 [Brassica napus]